MGTLTILFVALVAVFVGVYLYVPALTPSNIDKYEHDVKWRQVMHGEQQGFLRMILMWKAAPQIRDSLDEGGVIRSYGGTAPMCEQQNKQAVPPGIWAKYCQPAIDALAAPAANAPSKNIN